jgi:hypothetical protein
MWGTRRTPASSYPSPEQGRTIKVGETHTLQTDNKSVATILATFGIQYFKFFLEARLVIGVGRENCFCQ